MLTEDEENGKETSCNHVNYAVWMTCFQVSVLVIQVCLGVYLCHIKSEIHQDYLKELRSEVCGNEIKEAIENPQFCQIMSKCSVKKQAESNSDFFWGKDYYQQELRHRNKLVSC